MAPRRKTRRADEGLTLIELLVVITILGFLAGITVFKVMPALEEGKVARARADIDAYKNALKMYRLHHPRYPTTSQGLEALTEPSDMRPEGYLEQFNETDPWDNVYEYTSDGRTFLIISLGADGMEGGEGVDADIRSHDTEERGRSGY